MIEEPVAGYSTAVCTGTLYDDLTLNEVAGGYVSDFDFAELGQLVTIPVGSTINNSSYGSPVVSAGASYYGAYDWSLGATSPYPPGYPQSFGSHTHDSYEDLFDKDGGFGKWVAVTAPDNGSCCAMTLLALAALGVAARKMNRSEMAAK